MSRPRSVRVRRTAGSQGWLASKLGRPLSGARVPPDSWLASQVAYAVVDALALQGRGIREVWLHYQRGDVLVSEQRELEGYELATGVPLPFGKGKGELTEWICQQLRRVPCCP